MREWFQRLKVSRKLMLISIFFVMPDSLMLYLFITGINGHIEFARMEERGNAYQRPLEALLKLIPEHRLLLQRPSWEEGLVAEQVTRKQGEIDRAFTELQSVDAELGRDLQFTDEGLAKRNRGHFRAPTLREEWQELKSEAGGLDARALAARHEHLISDVRTMITHAGDLSNLILDPDLDSYYLMDATLLALPQTQARLAAVIAYGDTVLAQPAISELERRQFAIDANLLREADLERISGSVQTALNEDANFYGTSPTLQSRMPPRLKAFKELTNEFIRLTERLVSTEHPGVPANDYVAAGMRAREASFQLWTVACEELDSLLRTRIQAYERRRAQSLLVAALAGLAAFGFVTFITRSISGPLRAQSLELQTANAALGAQIAERTRAEAELRHSEAQLAAAQIIARVGSWDWEVASDRMSWSAENFRIHGMEPDAMKPTYKEALRLVHPEDRAISATTFQVAVQVKRPFSFEQRIIRHDGSERILQQRGDIVLGQDGLVAKVFGTAQDITERKGAEAALEQAHQELLDVSRHAGMAEVATGVLHNVGNVLNSVNVSVALIADRLGKSRLSHLGKVSALLTEHAGDLGNFLTHDPKGQKLPGFITSLAERLEAERAELLLESEGLAKNIAHIKDIVSVQQNYAKVSGVTEALPVLELVEDALQMNGAAFDRHGVEVVREFSPVPPVRVDKHKVLQILINVIRNAKYAVSESPRLDKRMTVRIAANGDNRVKIAVADNGIGIAPENLARIFAHGFTTKRDGHGFGLHSAALAATEMGGSLAAHSDGLGCGATFVLELPMEIPTQN